MKTVRTILTLLQVLTIFAAMPAHAEKKGGGAIAGGGGNASDAELYAEQESYAQVITKIKKFFKMNAKTMAQLFPEFTPKEMSDMAAKATIEVDNVPDQKDKNGDVRTCLNFRGEDHIRCDFEGLQKIKNNPQAQFVLMFHELLGLIGKEETPPQHIDQVQGYQISKRLAPFVTKVAEYDLVASSSSSQYDKMRLDEIFKRGFNIVAKVSSYPGIIVKAQNEYTMLNSLPGQEKYCDLVTAQSSEELFIKQGKAFPLVYVMYTGQKFDRMKSIARVEFEYQDLQGHKLRRIDLSKLNGPGPDQDKIYGFTLKDLKDYCGDFLKFELKSRY